MSLDILLSNLLQPAVLFFALGAAAALVRSDLELPQPAPKLLSLYLLMAIGFRGGVELATGGVDLRVFMRRLPARDLTSELRLDVTDDAPPRGARHAYWIRVTQEDGAQAWTSPVYLEAR